MFSSFDQRDLLAFPKGENDTDTIFAGVHFNLTTLKHWNYTYYSNDTLSNGSKCWLTFEPYNPRHMFNNGSFVNSTSCYSAVDNIGARGFAGIGFAIGFGIALVLTLTALAKHGPLYLPKERRFYPIGRRWQWYWACFTCAAALISLLTNVDVDRYYLQELPIIVTVFFWYLMCVGSMALVWEAVRHWGSWMERQFVDPNPFVYEQDDKRAKVEFYLPLWCYFWMWMNFFLIVPRSWKFLEMQRSQQQIDDIFVPGATSVRFTVAGFTLVVAWLTCCFSMIHSIHYYKPRHRGIFNKTRGWLTSVPLRFLLIIPLSLATIAYQLFITWEWKLSIMRAEGTVVPVVYGWGYGPTLLILYIQILYGYFSPNEDKELYRQRHERGDRINRELGIVAKPAWWRRVRGDHNVRSMRDKILSNVNEVGGPRGVGRRQEDDFERHIREDAQGAAINDDDIELSSMAADDPYNPRVDRAGAKSVTSPLVNSHDPFASTHSNPPPPYNDIERGRVPSTAVRSNSTSTTNSISSPPQQIRSMLDI